MFDLSKFSFRNRAYLNLILVAAIWGIASPVIKFTFNGIDPLPFLAYRFLIAGTISLIFFARKIRRGKKFRQLRANFWAASLYGILAVPVALGILFFGLEKSTVLDLTLVGTIGPLIVTAGGALIFHDKITKKEKLGISIVIVGLVINTFFPLFQAGEAVKFSGNILLVLYLFSDSGSILLAKYIIRNKVKSSNLTNLAFLMGAITLAPIAIYKYGFFGFVDTIISLPLKYHLGVWYMAVLSGNLAYLLYVKSQKSIEVSEASLFMYLQPLFTIPLAVFWLDEKLTLPFVVGAVIIAIGIYIAEKKTKKPVNHSQLPK
ncbi:DMT family transporter [Candidatus Woesebacteria bacterium]|nr:MAG: DMT family transporter [Candidatus Woesebacteria bacterium]